MTSNRKRDNRDIIRKIEQNDRRARRVEKRSIGSDVTQFVGRDRDRITPVIMGTVNLANHAAGSAAEAAQDAQDAVAEVGEVVEGLLPRYPVAPTTLTGSTTSGWDSKGAMPIAEVLLNWGAVTQNADGTPTTPNYYEVEAAVTTVGTYTTLARVNSTSARVVNLPVSTGYSFRVRAFNSPGEPGAYSPVFTVTTGSPTAKMAAPTGVGATSQLSVINVTWTGKIGANVDPPLHFRHAYAEIAAAPYTTYNRMGAPFLRDTRTITIAGNFTVGAEYRVRLVAVDGIGITSDPSGYVTVTVQGVDSAALSATINQTIQDAHDTAHTAAEDLATLDDRLSSLDNPGAILDQMRDSIQAAQDTADGLVQRHYSENPPWPNGSSQPASRVGDLWLKTSTAVAYRWTGTLWDEIPGDDVSVALREARAAQDAAEDAMTAAAQAQKEASGKITTFYVAAQPTATGVGDLWVKTDVIPNQLRRWTGTTWEVVTDSILLRAYINASDAQATADKKIQTFAQDEPPANNTANDLSVGDIWLDTNDGNKMHRWDGDSWEPFQDRGISAAQQAAENAASAAASAAGIGNAAQKQADLGYWQARAVNAKLNHPDTTFAEDRGGTGAYRSGGGGTTLERVVAPTGTPTTSGYILRALDSGSVTSGTASFTGFYPFNPSLTARPGAIFLQRFVARIPVGYEFVSASNSVGGPPGAEGIPQTSGTFLTPTTGTGTWQTYIKLIVCGTDPSATYSTTGHVYVRGPGRAAADPIAMELAQHEVLDLTDTVVRPDILIQSSAPPISMRKSTTLWIDTTAIGSPPVAGNIPKRWNGTAWVAVTDKTATDAAAAAAAAASAAQTANNKAGDALTSANGKNNVIYSTLPANGTTNPDTGVPNVKGDVWFQSGTADGVTGIIGQWQWTGSAWLQTTVTHEVIASLDLGNLTVVGKLNGNHIEARTIAVDKLLVGGDSANLIQDLIRETNSVAPHQAGSFASAFYPIATSTDTPQDGGTSPGRHYFAVRDDRSDGSYGAIVEWAGTNGSLRIPVDPNKRYRLSALIKAGGSYPNGLPTIRWAYRERDEAGAQVAFTVAGAAVPLAWRWQEVSGEFITSPTTATVEVTIQSNRINANTRIAVPSLKAMVGSTLIEDGAITTPKIFTGAVTTKTLAANAVNAEKMLIGDFTNLIEGADFPGTSTTITADPETGVPGWTPAVGSATVSTTTGLPGRALRFVGPAEAAVWNNRYFDIEPVINNVTGEVTMPSFYLQAKYYNQRSVPAVLRVQWYDQSKSAITGGVSDMLLQTNGATWSTASDTVGSLSIPGAPLTARYGRLQVLSPTGDATADASANLYIGHITLRRMNGGELLVDGTIRGRHIETETLETRHFRAGTIDGNIISAGTLRAGAVEPLFGKELVLTGNTTIQAVYEDMAEMEESVREEIRQTANVYRFDAEAAKIANADSQYQVWIYNNKMEIRYNDAAVSTWSESKMVVDTFEGKNVTLANHEMQTYTGPAGGTIIRALSSGA